MAKREGQPTRKMRKQLATFKSYLAQHHIRNLAEFDEHSKRMPDDAYKRILGLIPLVFPSSNSRSQPAATRS
jgi:hypothetical protein